jgi:16S rRNA (cytosine967-C5)-methyltransferase
MERDVLALLRMGCYQALRMRVSDHAVVNETVLVAKRQQLHRASGFINAVLRSIVSKDSRHWEDLIRHSENTVVSHPRWIAQEIELAVRECDGEGELSEALEAHNVAPKVTLCHLPGLSEPARPARTPYSPLGAILSGGNPGELEGVRQGVVRVQDEGSQLAALLLTRFKPLQSGDTLWDMCAGPGGKTALLAAEARIAGATVLATELSSHRAQLVKASVSAITAISPQTVTVVTADARNRPERAPFSRILLDAPCSGLGALRRRPEARWSKTPEQLRDLVTVQKELLAVGLDCLAPGGVLAYVTCSPVVAETTEVVSSVLGERTDCDGLDTTEALAHIAAKPVPQARRGSAVQLWTHRHGTDAMFIQLIRRQPSIG